MNIEALNNIIKHTDEMNKNIEKCISNGIEFYLHEKKINGLKFEYHMDNEESYVSIALTYNGKAIDLEDKEKSAKFYLYGYEIDKYYLEFGYGIKHEEGEFYYRPTILKLDREDNLVGGVYFSAKFKEYKKYLSTKAWEWKRKEKLEEAKYKCQLCGKSNIELHVHHNNYDNLCFEEMSDLIVLCKKCHEKFHDIEDI